MQRLYVNRDEPIYTYAIQFMEHYWGVKGTFPGSQPISIEYKHFKILKKHSYVVCEKTDGVRYMMLAFMFDNKKRCMFVNRALDMFECPLNFRKAVYDGTILEGELYEDTFMIYDCLIACGKNVGREDLIIRIDACERVKKMLMSMKYDPVKIQLKKFHLLQEFETFMNEYLPTVTQKMDGLVFTPINYPVQTGTHEAMFKWKPRDKNTIDFQFKKKGDLWKLYVQEKGKLVFESEIREDQVPEGVEVEEDAIVECQYMFNDSPMWWKPIQRRHDKTYPNGRRTFYRTLVNIKEDIRMSDFLTCT